ncbi:hypothetical protein P3T76_007729 [Phytophthora citrophthora]|uniref:RxLR effector PexRD54 WY domain-containing protein n=1 Tax=Phytophthora citrophthora TaxID=4793 RepID=A0AAD9GMQ3_9STRA|nr:hypothetical protein P3T76_007729 [Phytophthora citrophthora]
MCTFRAVLAIAALLASTSDVVEAQTKVLVQSPVHEIPETSVYRFLKTRNSEEDEARAVSKSSIHFEGLKVSTDDVFKLLQLDDAAENLLSNPLLSAWLSYMKRFNRHNPSRKTSLFTTLLAHYGDDGLAKIIEASKHVTRTKTLAKQLQGEQIQRWLAQKLSLDEVFVLLKLDKAGDQLFSQSQVLTWVKYLDDYNEEYKKSITIFSFLKPKYKEETLVQMLIAAEKAPNTKKIAVAAQTEQTKLWLNEMKTPDDVFTLLKLKEEQSALFSSPLFPAWLKYLDEFNLLDPEAKVVLPFTTLKKHYEVEALAKMILSASKDPSTSDLAKKLHSEQLREWYSSLKPPELLFKALKLDKTGSKLFERSLFTVWKEYVEFIKLMDPTIKSNLLTPLIKIYGEKKLAKILVTAEKVPKTKKIATELQELQINRWLNEKKAPKMVYSLLRVEGTLANDPSRVFYEKYIEAVKQLP